MNQHSKESYKHKYAKHLLANWLKEKYLRIDIESSFSMCGFTWFIPDLACYNENGIIDVFEVVHTHNVSLLKQWKMYVYFKTHKWKVNVYQIQAEWILRQVDVPKKLQLTKII